VRTEATEDFRMVDKGLLVTAIFSELYGSIMSETVSSIGSGGMKLIWGRVSVDGSDRMGGRRSVCCLLIAMGWLSVETSEIDEFPSELPPRRLRLGGLTDVASLRVSSRLRGDTALLLGIVVPVCGRLLGTATGVMLAGSARVFTSGEAAGVF